MNAPTGTRCPACAEPVLATDAFCEGCGTRLGAPAPSSGPPSSGPPSSGAPSSAAAPRGGAAPDCPCGAGRADADGYCDSCGRLVPDGRDHVELDLGARGALVSDRGLRHARNEDAGALAVGTGDSLVVAVADGVSTSRDPQAAATAAGAAAVAVLGAVATEPTDTELRAAVEAAAAAVAAATDPRLLDDAGRARRDAAVPACTLVAAHLSRRTITLVGVGDSRGYWLPDDPERPAEQLTADDSLAAEAIAAGVPPADAYTAPGAHAITAWIGVDAGPVTPRPVRCPVTGPGTLVLCSDGLWNYLTDPAEFTREVRARLAAAAGSPLAAARALTDFARAAGGHDNITVAIVPVPDPRAGDQ